MSEPSPLLEAYLNGELDDQGFVALNEWLREDPEHLHQWVVSSFIVQELGEVLTEQLGAPAQPIVTDKVSAAKQGVVDANVLDLLQQIEASVEDAPLRDLTSVFDSKPAFNRKPKSEDIDFSTAVRELSWAAGKVARHLIVSKYVIGGAIAAALLLALFVINPFATEAPDTVAERPGDAMPLAEATAPSTVVATLTNTRNAEWGNTLAERSLTRGSALHPKQRLTLTAGFAEITTSRGAVATLEAPASVEFTDNPNALRLYHGKLVGICKTPSSKGFLVRTSHMDVTDVGTEFGVDATSNRGTVVEVFQGLVLVQNGGDADPSSQIEVAGGQLAYTTDGVIRVAAAVTGETRFANRHVFNRQRQWQIHRDQQMRDPKLLAYYTFEEKAGNTLKEARGVRDFDGVIHGTQWVEGRFPWKPGLRFGGPATGDRVELSELASGRMNFNGSFSVVVWFKADPFSRDWQTLISKGEKQWRLARNTMWTNHPHANGDPHEPSALNFGYDIQTGANPPDLPGSTAVDDGRWHQAVLVFEVDANGATKHLYIDGESDAEPTRVNVITPSDAAVWIGGNSERPNSRNFRGIIDELAIYERALTPEQVAELYRAGTPTKQPPISTDGSAP